MSRILIDLIVDSLNGDAAAALLHNNNNKYHRRTSYQSISRVQTDKEMKLKSVAFWIMQKSNRCSKMWYDPRFWSLECWMFYRQSPIICPSKTNTPLWGASKLAQLRKPVYNSRNVDSISSDHDDQNLSLLKIEKHKMSESGDEEVVIRENERIPLLSDIHQEDDQEQEPTYWQRLRQRRKR